jgi:hypothetical protein
MEDREPQVSAEQLAALRRLRVAFGPVEVVEVVADDANSGEEPADNTHGELRSTMTDPRRMTPKEFERRPRCSAGR